MFHPRQRGLGVCGAALKVLGRAGGVLATENTENTEK